MVNRSTKIGFICIVQYRLSLLLYSFYLKFLKNIWWSMSWWLVWIGYLCLLLIWFLLFWWFINHKLIQDREMIFYQLLLTSFIVLALLLGLRWVRFLVPGISKTHGLIWLYWSLVLESLSLPHFYQKKSTKKNKNKKVFLLCANRPQQIFTKWG